MHISYIHVYFPFVQVQCDFCRAYLQEREDVSSRNPTDLTQETLGWLKIISFIMNQHIYIHSHWYCFSYYITYIILILDKLLSIYLFVYIFVYIYITYIHQLTSLFLLLAPLDVGSSPRRIGGHLGVLLLVVAICIASYGIRRFRLVDWDWAGVDPTQRAIWKRSTKNGKHHDTRKYQEHKLQKWEALKMNLNSKKAPKQS